jgi:HK97 family phage major capsid protein
VPVKSIHSTGDKIMDFQQLVQKADIALSDLTGSGGYLQPEQQKRFFRKIIDTPTIFQKARFIPMSRPQLQINKIGFNNRILVAANQGAIGGYETGVTSTRALSPSQRVSPQLGKILLSTSELIAEINLPYEVLEQNIEGGEIDNTQFQQTVLDMIAEAAARDLEEKIILGDTTSADPYLALQNGIITSTVSNIVNNNGGIVSPNLFRNMINALPPKYRRFINTMNFFVSRTREVDYRLQVSNRQTSLGDAVLTGKAPVSALGVEIAGASQMPDATAMMLAPQNLVVGMQRNIRMEWDRNIRERVIIIVLTMTIDHQYEEEDMTVKAINLGSN